MGEDETASDSDDQKEQKKWYQCIAENRLRELENVSTEQDNVRLQGAKCRGSSDWINTLPSSTLKLKLTHEQFRLASSLRLGANISSPYTCVCGAQADVKGIHALSCAKSSSRNYPTEGKNVAKYANATPMKNLIGSNCNNVFAFHICTLYAV